MFSFLKNIYRNQVLSQLGSTKLYNWAKDQCFQKGRKCMDPIAIGGKSFLAAPRAAIDHNQPFRLLINISSTAGCKRFIFCLAVKYSKNARPFVSFQVNKIFGQRCLRIYKQSKLLLILNGNHQADKIFLFVTWEKVLLRITVWRHCLVLPPHRRVTIAAAAAAAVAAVAAFHCHMKIHFAWRQKPYDCTL